MQIFLTTVLQHLFSFSCSFCSYRKDLSLTTETLPSTLPPTKKKNQTLLKVWIIHIFQNLNIPARYYVCIQLYCLYQSKTSYFCTVKLQELTKRPVPAVPMVQLMAMGNDLLKKKKKELRLTRKVTCNIICSLWFLMYCCSRAKMVWD